MSLFVERNGLRVYRYTVVCPRLPDGFDGCRIMHISDLHSEGFGENGEPLAAACAEFAPELIFFTGDLVTRCDPPPKLRYDLRVMRRLSRIAPIYYSRGNHESDSPDKAAWVEERLKKLGVTVLLNEKTRIYRGGEHITVYGLEMPPRFYRNGDGSYFRLPKFTYAELKRLLGEPDRGEFAMLMAHNPLPFESYAEWGADLTLSGHVHGGMVRVFGVGLLSPERRFLPRYTMGIYSLPTKIGTAKMAVSAGLGKFRLNNPPMISVIELKKGK